MSMERAVEVVFWRRTDMAGLERLALALSDEVVTAVSTIICVEDRGFQIAHRWKLTPDWRTLSLEVEKQEATGYAHLSLERAGDGWKVDGIHHPDLEAADEPDLSVTPFCNTLPIRRLMREKRQSLTIDTCFVDAASMTVARSSQRYEWVRPGVVRYIDLGLFAGFEAELQVDHSGLVMSYQELFERITPG